MPYPFIWGLYDGKKFETFDTTAEFVGRVRERNIILYAHNGGKFDFMYLLPHVGKSKVQIINGRIVAMFLGRAELRDSFAAVPEALKNIHKKEIDYAKLEPHCRAQHMPEIVEYLKYDCIYLYDLMKRYREIAGTNKTIASNALVFAKKQGIDIGKSTYNFDKNFRKYYYGGRCECFQTGTYHNVKIVDIHSAYPYAMTHDHPTGTERSARSDFGNLSREEIQRSFIIVECTSRGAFPKRMKLDGITGLHFPHEYDEYYVTGWEYLAALEYGLISDVKIISVYYFENKINFTPYVNHWFEFKQKHAQRSTPEEKINYTIGKIMANSLYGKAAQDPSNYYDYEIHPGGTPVNFDEGWELYTEFENLEFHRRPTLWKYQHSVDTDPVTKKKTVFSTGHEWEGRRIYKNVATGASITGFCRAQLLKAASTIGWEHIIYMDTDSLILKQEADLSRLPISDKLGDWGVEEYAAPILHAAGKKLYAAQLSELGKNGKPLIKVASKGVRFGLEEMERLLKGEEIVWKNQAPTFSVSRGHLPGSEWNDTRTKKSIKKDAATLDQDDYFVRRCVKKRVKTS